MRLMLTTNFVEGFYSQHFDAYKMTFLVHLEFVYVDSTSETYVS